jgi:hypothetical protein
MRFFFYAALVLLSFPSHPAVEANQPDVHSGTPVPVTPLIPRKCPSCSFTDNSGLKEKLRLVIRDRGAWRRVWNEIYSPSYSLPKLREIDFSREMVVVAALGTRGSSGYGIVVDRASEQDRQLELHVVSRSPGRNCPALAVMTAPVDIVRLPRIEASAVFQENDVVDECK